MKRITVGIALVTLAVAFSIALFCPNEGDALEDEKIAAVHYFHSWSKGEFDPQPLLDRKVRQVVLVPYAYQSGHLDADLRIDSRRRNSSRRDSLFVAHAQEIQESGFEVVIKPHIWMGTEDGKWRSDIDFTSDSVGLAWGEKYRKFILRYARMSELLGNSLFCIGTELTLLTKSHPYYWRDLIKEVRSVYSGKLFYAANWYEELEAITFWDDLDYIGVQAYYPLTKTENPDLKTLLKGWQPIKNGLKKLSKKYNRPVLFSEMGYRSTACAAIKPWEWVDHEDEDQPFELSLATQKVCYEAVFHSFWHEPWFAGLMVWQWRGNHTRAGGPTNLNFTPQNKPAQEVLTKWFNTRDL